MNFKLGIELNKEIIARSIEILSNRCRLDPQDSLNGPIFGLQRRVIYQGLLIDKACTEEPFPDPQDLGIRKSPEWFYQLPEIQGRNLGT
jgi:hypothetical protein